MEVLLDLKVWSNYQIRFGLLILNQYFMIHSDKSCKTWKNFSTMAIFIHKANRVHSPMKSQMIVKVIQIKDTLWNREVFHKSFSHSHFMEKGKIHLIQSIRLFFYMKYTRINSNISD